MKTPNETFTFLRMAARKAGLAGVMGALLLRCASGALTPVFDFQNAPPGNQTGGPWMLGSDFTVNSPIVISDIGAFDNGGNGFALNIPVAVYNAAGSIVLGTQFTLTTAGTTYDAATQTRWLQITPVILAPGDYSVVAGNYGSASGYQNDYNAAADPNAPPSPLIFNNLGGALTLDGGRWLSQGGPLVALPGSITSWDGINDGPGSTLPNPLFAAGTVAIAVPEPTTMLAGLLLVVVLGATVFRCGLVRMSAALWRAQRTGAACGGCARTEQQEGNSNGWRMKHPRYRPREHR